MQHKQVAIKSLLVIAKRQNWSRQKLRSIRGQMLSTEDAERLEYLDSIAKIEKKFTFEDVKELITIYKQKIKELKKVFKL